VSGIIGAQISRSFRTTALACLLCSLPVLATAAGVSFVPAGLLQGNQTSRPDLSVLTYHVPGGVIIADRLAPGQATRFGTAFPRHSQKAEFFLVQNKGHDRPAHEVARILASLGDIPWHSGNTFLVEIPAANQARFAALDLDRAHIPLTAPPAGWDRLQGEPVASAVARGPTDLILIQDFVNNISQPAFFQTIQEISGHAYFFFGGLRSVSTRFYSSADKDLVADYLAAKLTGYGYTVTFENFMSGSTPCRNIVATKLGTVTPTEYVVVGGHYDSISPDPTNTAPGAEDNGSGIAAIMEMARISAARDFERSVQFVLFDSEEQGLYGSAHFVANATAASRNIVGAVILDMVSYYNTSYAVRIEGQTPWEWLMAIMETKVNLNTNIASQKDYLSWGSDHVPFQQAGIPAFLAIDYDYDSYPGYHQTNDVWGQIAGTAQLGTQITTACAATLAEVAILQPDPSAVGDLPAYGAIDLVAFPNPFNPQVEIAFNLDQEQTGILRVYDVSGKLVTNLVGGPFAAGLNRVRWNGTDAAGRAVSSGTYICQLQAGDATTSVAVELVR